MCSRPGIAGLFNRVFVEATIRYLECRALPSDGPIGVVVGDCLVPIAIRRIAESKGSTGSNVHRLSVHAGIVGSIVGDRHSDSFAAGVGYNFSNVA